MYRKANDYFFIQKLKYINNTYKFLFELIFFYFQKNY